MRVFWSRVECEAAVGSNVRSVPYGQMKSRAGKRQREEKEYEERRCRCAKR